LLDSLLQESLRSKTRMSPKKSKPQSIVSPSPKNLKPRKSSVSRKIIIWGLVSSIALVMVACVLDYQQGKLANHTSRLPYEVQVATKYMVDMASEVPHKMEVFYDGARGQMIILTGKMYIGDKTVAQMLFGVTDEEDPTPKDVKADFEQEDEIEDLVDTLEELKKNLQEVAIKLRKEEEMRLYEEKRQQLKEEAIKVMEAEKQAAMEVLLEEKAKLRAKIETETASRKLNEEGEVEDNDQKFVEEAKAEVAASAEAVKSKIADQAKAASELILEKQREEMARLSEKLNKKLETSKLEAEELGKGNYKDEKKSESKQQVNEEEPMEKVGQEELIQVIEEENMELVVEEETNQQDRKEEFEREDFKKDSSKKNNEEDGAE